MCEIAYMGDAVLYFTKKVYDKYVHPKTYTRLAICLFYLLDFNFMSIKRMAGILFKGSNFLLKVPKCEIFDRSDFPDFYTIKSLCEGDFGVKIKNIYKNI
jgi:hypothetical protein